MSVNKSSDEITINEFLREEFRRLELFRDDWIKQQEEQGIQDWPETMNYSEWHQQMTVFFELETNND